MTNKWMTSGAMRLKANLNRSFGARKNTKSAATHRSQIKNYESIVVSRRRGMATLHTAKSSRNTTSNKATTSGRTNNNNRSNSNNSNSRKLIRSTQAFSHSNNRNSQNDFDSIERIVTLQEQQARNRTEVAMRERNIQQQMSFDDQEETAQQFREHSVRS